MKEANIYYQMVIKKLCPNLSKKEYEAKKQNVSNDFDEIIKIENPNVTKEEYVECFIEYCNKLKAETPPLNIRCVNANRTILGTSGGGKHYDGKKERRMTKHEVDVIGGLNMTDQISNDAYKQIMIAAQDENEVGDVLNKIREEIDRQEKWLMSAGYNAYNVDIAFSSIKSVLAKSEGIIPALEQEPMFDKIKGYINHIRNTGLGKKKSLEFIEKYIDGLKAESEGIVCQKRLR